MKMPVTLCALLFVTAAGGLVVPSGGHAQVYPNRSIRLIVPFSPGGSTDILARIVAQKLSESLRQQVVVDNRGGAGGIIGTEFAARAAPDGYTLLMGHIGTLSMNPSLYPKLPYDPVTDFAPITMLAVMPNGMVVHPSLRVHSIKASGALQE